MKREWTIKPLCFGEFPVFEKSVFTYNRHAGEKIPAPILGWLLQSGGESILVDTGPSTPELAAGWHTPIREACEIVTASRQAESARRFLAYLAGPNGRQILESHGLTPPQ